MLQLLFKSYPEKLLQGLLLTALGLLTESVWADPANLATLLQHESFSNADYDSLYFAVGDDPVTLTREAKQIWESVQAQNNPLLKARAGWLLAKVYDTESRGAVTEILRESTRLIDQFHLPISRSEMLFHQLYLDVEEERITAQEAADNLVKYAESIEPAIAKAYALSRITFMFADRSIRSQDIPKLLIELRQLTLYQTNAVSATNIKPFYYTANILSLIGETDEAQALNHKLEMYCDANKMRAICATFLYEFGRILAYAGTPDKLEAAVQAYTKSIELSKDLNDSQSVANGYYGIAVAYNRAKKYHLGLEYGNLALKTFEALDAKVWAASTLKHIANSYLGLGQNLKALESAKQALSICPLEYKVDLVDMHKVISKSYEALGKYDEALRSFKLYRELEAETRTDALKKELITLRNSTELRVEAEKNRALLIEVKLKDKELKETQTLRWVLLTFCLLALAIIGLLSRAFLQSRRARITQLKMQAILENIDEGILLVDPSLRIGKIHSTHLNRLMNDQEKFAGCEFISRIFQAFDINREQISVVENVLRAVFHESSIAWQLNEDALPRELYFKDSQRVMALNWVPMLNKDDQIIFVLVSLRDITSRRQLEVAVEIERGQAKGRAEILGELMKADLAGSHRLVTLVQDVYSRLMQEGEAQDFKTMMRDLHTAKGVARSLGLKILSSLIHDWEDKVRALESGETAWLVLRPDFEQERRILDNYALLSQFGLQTLPKANGSLLSLVGSMQRSLQEQAAEGGIAKLRLVVDDSWGAWDASLMNVLNDSLPHLLSNSLDHGFIRAHKGRDQPTEARIELAAQETPDGLSLCIQDNGVGLNWEKLRTLALEKNFVAAEGQTYANVIFQDGASTADQVSSTSGRGVGLAAVKAQIESLSGHIEVASPEAGGTSFTLRIPRRTPKAS